MMPSTWYGRFSTYVALFCFLLFESAPFDFAAGKLNYVTFHPPGEKTQPMTIALSEAPFHLANMKDLNSDPNKFQEIDAFGKRAYEKLKGFLETSGKKIGFEHNCPNYTFTLVPPDEGEMEIYYPEVCKSSLERIYVSFYFPGKEELLMTIVVTEPDSAPVHLLNQEDLNTDSEKYKEIDVFGRKMRKKLYNYLDDKNTQEITEFCPVYSFTNAIPEAAELEIFVPQGCDTIEIVYLNMFEEVRNTTMSRVTVPRSFLNNTNVTSEALRNFYVNLLGIRPAWRQFIPKPDLITLPPKYFIKIMETCENEYRLFIIEMCTESKEPNFMSPTEIISNGTLCDCFWKECKQFCNQK